MKKILLPFLIPALLFGASCKNEPKKITTSSEALDKFEQSKGIDKGTKSYAITLPDGWTTKDTTLNGVKFRFFYPPAEVTQNTGVNANILNESMQGASFDEYMRKTQQTMGSYMNGYKKIDDGDIVAGNVKGKWLHYYAVINNLDLECVVYVFPSDDGAAYILTTGSLKGKMDQFRPTFDAMAKSFRFTN